MLTYAIILAGHQCRQQNSIMTQIGPSHGAGFAAQVAAESLAKPGDPLWLKRLFYLTCLFCGYLLCVEALTLALGLSSLTQALLRLFPYCGFAIAFIYYGRIVAKPTPRNLLMIISLAAVFVILFTGVTYHLNWFRGIPILGGDWSGRGELRTTCEILAFCSFLLGSYIALGETLQSEEALKRSEERLRLIADHVESVFWVSDVGLSQMKFVSPAYEIIWGRTAESLYRSPRSFLEAIHPEDSPQVISRLRAEPGEKQHSFELEYRILRPDGSTRWIRDRGFPVQDKEGRITDLVGIADDITARKTADEALRASEEQFRKLFEESPVGIAFLGKQREFLKVNRQYCASLGYNEDEILRRGLKGLLHPDDYEPSIALGDKLRSGEISFFHLEQRCVHKNGNVVWTDTNIRAVRDPQGNVLHTIAWIQDITERKQAEAELRKLSQAVEQSPASIVITDVTGAIEYVNPKFTRLTGYSLAEVLGKTPRVLKGDKTSAEEYKGLWQSITHGQEWHGEFHNRKKNGEFYWELATVSPIVDAQGRISHFLAVKEDITERKSLEEKLRQAQKLEGIGRLAGGIAHDFNNMLAFTILRLGALQQRTGLEADVQESLRELDQEARRAADLTRQLLIFSRRSVLQVQTIDLNEVVTHLLKMLRRMIGEHVTIHFEPNPALPPIDADLGMMEQVIMNLCVNARDAMPRGGRIVIGLVSVQVEKSRGEVTPETEPRRYVCLSVADTGCGMDDATLKQIFEPFFTTKEVGKGTGLGLATVHGIVGQHKGWVEVESKVGEGTSFCVFLPASANRIVERSPAERAETLRGKETILLVEDEPSLRLVIGESLRDLGYVIHEAANGQEALEVWQRHHAQIDLLFSDMVMPGGISGQDLAERFREEKQGLKVILSSGYSPETVGQRFQSEATPVLLQKPYRLEELSRTVRDCLDQR